MSGGRSDNGVAPANNPKTVTLGAVSGRASDMIREMVAYGDTTRGCRDDGSYKVGRL